MQQPKLNHSNVVISVNNVIHFISFHYYYYFLKLINNNNNNNNRGKEIKNKYTQDTVNSFDKKGEKDENKIFNLM